MAQDLPYTVVYGKIPDLIKKISDAKVPEIFSHAFLKDTLGFKSSNDRNLIGIVKALGLIDSSGKPTPRYRELKNNSSRASAIAAGVREAYGALFDANENAHTLSSEDLKGLVAQVAGTDKDMTSRIFYTLNALIKEADFGSAPSKEDKGGTQDEKEDKPGAPAGAAPVGAMKRSGIAREKSTEFHFNIQVHLPNNGTEETYLNIFNALREALQ